MVHPQGIYPKGLIRRYMLIVFIFFCQTSICSVGFAWTVPATGMTQCSNIYDVIPCPQPGQDFYGQDGNYQNFPHEFRDNLDDTITDLSTGLQWQKTVYETEKSWYYANEICESAAYSGFNDWRLPSVLELFTIMDFSTHDFTIDQAFNIVGRFYWTSTVTAWTDYRAFTLDFVWRNTYADQKGYETYFRCVRGAKLNPSYIDNGNGTISDTASNLMWEKGMSGPMTWKEALHYCENLQTAGYSDWQLPNIHMLQTLVDYSRYDPALNPVVSGISELFWSGTTELATQNNNVYNAFVVDFEDGQVKTIGKNYERYVRCTRRISSTPPTPSTDISPLYMLLFHN